MTISLALKKIYASAPPDQRYIETLEINHSTFAAPYYFTNDVFEHDFLRVSGDAATVKFTPMPFTVQLPSEDNSGNQELTIALINSGREMMAALEKAQTKPEDNIACIYRVYLAEGSKDPQIDPPLTLTITDISADANSVTASASRFDVLGRQFPTELYTTDKFPGLRR